MDNICFASLKLGRNPLCALNIQFYHIYNKFDSLFLELSYYTLSIHAPGLKTSNNFKCISLSISKYGILMNIISIGKEP